MSHQEEILRNYFETLERYVDSRIALAMHPDPSPIHARAEAHCDHARLLHEMAVQGLLTLATEHTVDAISRGVDRRLNKSTEGKG